MSRAQRVSIDHKFCSWRPLCWKLQLADATLPLLRGAERDIARLAGGTAGKAKCLGEKGLFATLYAGIRADMRMRRICATSC